MVMRAAKALLVGGISDPVIIPHSLQGRAPEPAYLSDLGDRLAQVGIRYVHVAALEQWSHGASEAEMQRIFIVKSFVWQNRVWIVRQPFSDVEFAQWPSELQALWEDTY